jgi:hypothetical protein
MKGIHSCFADRNYGTIMVFCRIHAMQAKGNQGTALFFADTSYGMIHRIHVMQTKENQGTALCLCGHKLYNDHGVSRIHIMQTEGNQVNHFLSLRHEISH